MRLCQSEVFFVEVKLFCCSEAFFVEVKLFCRSEADQSTIYSHVYIIKNLIFNRVTLEFRMINEALVSLNSYILECIDPRAKSAYRRNLSWNTQLNEG